MAEEEPRVQKVLAYLESIKEHGLVRPKTIGEAIGESAQTVGKDLHDLKERGLAVAEEEGLWKITPDGTAWIIEAKPKAQPKPKPEPKSEPKAEEKGTVPTRSDIFKSIENGDGCSHRPR
jgi:DeoR/GlpR family transcriptional regulator of sugar metabolism